MRKIEKDEILIPLLKNYENEKQFYEKFSDLIRSGGKQVLAEPFGISIIITNIVESDQIENLLNSLKNNKKFIQTVRGEKDDLDKALFDEDSIYSFQRYVFKSNEHIVMNVKEQDKPINFTFFPSLAITNLQHHIVSFTFTTMTEFNSKNEVEGEYYKLSNKLVIDLIKSDTTIAFYELKSKVKALGYLFSWNEILENDNGKLIEILTEKFGIDLGKNAKIEKIGGDKAIKVSNGKNCLSLKLNNEKTEVTLKINNGSIEKLTAEIENGRLNIYDNSLINFLKIDKNTFIALEFWKKKWKSDGNNLLDAADYIKENPFYFYSILTMNKNVFRRNFKNILDTLGWCFSSSIVQRGLFSRNIYLAVSLKPRGEIFEDVGHDGTEYKAWEILALQKHLLNLIDIYYGKYILEKNKEVRFLQKLYNYYEKYILRKDKKIRKKIEVLVEELDKVYDFNALFKKIGKGEIWINFNTYLQSITGISSYHDLYLSRHEKMLEGVDRSENLHLTQLNTILSGLIFSTIFISIITFLLDGDQKVKKIMCNTSGVAELWGTTGETVEVSMLYTFLVAFFFVVIFYFFIMPLLRKLKF